MSTNIKDKRRKEIIEISSNLFYKKGIANTTISEITITANIGKGTFYEYFKNKEEVIDEYIKVYFENMHLLIFENIENLETNKEKILFIVKSLFMSKSVDEKFTYIFIEFLRMTFNNNKEESRKLYEFNQQNIDLINKYLQKGIEEKEFIPCNTLNIAFEIISSILGNIVLSLSYEFKECDKSTKYNVKTILDSIEYKNTF
ncbi:TetR/AcrR family transcriptional regulator [Poseidonibacter lekithochrous]|uniref:TetR/AcrR family transcriptional regulator n=1 Tax=Poseidonibacter TaxID=2321187 RepID=UPI001C089939|nr:MULTISPECIES: TetR/AcrR family transcriptional regulator [Poseidonibacter]MBU3014944.1 TetR/AcrR family transcriptional regulator [Poseidonibacter lekithochrous]MDO6828242.1 TetR/AcrR family transcriptional regulator [Poseidonibacter sp. 1_MG-2023]